MSTPAAPRSSRAVGVGLATVALDGTVLDTWYPLPELSDAADGMAEEPGTVVVPAGELEPALVEALGTDEERGVEVVAVRTVADLTGPPASAYDVYLRLHLLSHRLVAPHGVDLSGMFGLLANVVWTNHGPCPVPEFERVRARLRARGPVTVHSVDKFPRMVDYVIPTGVRIGDTPHERQRAHQNAGTPIIHQGFVNINTRTLGASMVEGRISGGVVVGDGSDVGGGASIMGTLSGGGKEVVSIGERCLLGANAGIGISLGDDCVVEAGLYVTAGTRVTLDDGSVVKAVELSGRSGILLRRDSVTGAVHALPRTEGAKVELNAALHAND